MAGLKPPPSSTFRSFPAEKRERKVEMEMGNPACHMFLTVNINVRLYLCNMFAQREEVG